MHINELKESGKCNTKGKGVEISSREIKLFFFFLSCLGYESHTIISCHKKNGQHTFCVWAQESTATVPFNCHHSMLPPSTPAVPEQGSPGNHIS